MSEQRNSTYDDSARAAGKVGRAARKAAGKAALRGAKDLSKVIPAKVKIALAVILILLLLIQIIAGGTSSSSFDATNYLTAENAKELNAPENDEEFSSVYSKKPSIDITVKLASIIEEAKQRDRSRLEAKYQKMYGENYEVTFECDTDTMPVYVSDEYTPGDTNASIEILMVDDDPDNERVADRFRKEGCNVTTVTSINKIDTNKYDALVIPGGHNVTPSLYGAKRSKHTSGTNLKKDKNQIAAVEKFSAAGKPILGLCRGMQLINVAFGGTIDQGDGTYHNYKHKVTVDKSSWLYSEYGKSVQAYHFHKQQVKKLGTGFKATMWSSKGNQTLIEGMEHTSKPIYCLQWHPDSSEMNGGKNGYDDGLKVFKKFVKVIKSKKGTQSTVTAPGGSTAGEQAVAWGKTQLNKGWKYARFSTIPDAACPVCEPNKNKTGWQCIGFVTACYFHGAGVRSDIHHQRSKNKCHLDGLGNGGNGDRDVPANSLYGNSAAEIEKKWKARNGDDWAMISTKSGSLKKGHIPESELEVGDVIHFYNGNGRNYHTAIYAGNGKYLQSTGGKGVCWGSYTKNAPVRTAFRYMGQGSGGEKASSGIQYEAKEFPTVIGSISAATASRKIELTEMKYAAQSMAYDKGTFYVQRITWEAGGQHGYIEAYSALGSHLRCSEYINKLYHGNGLTIKDSKLYSVTCLGRGDNTKAQVIDPDSLEWKSTQELPCGTSGIAYDVKTGKWCLSSGENIRVYDGSLKKNALSLSIKKKRWKTAQDIAAYDGVIMVCIDTGSGSVIDLYSEITGDYLGTYKAEDGDEIESAAVNDDGNLCVLFHSSTDYILETGVAVGGSANPSSTGIVTESDMDLLAAYSISLGNDALKYDSDGEEEKDDDAILSWKYKDITGKPVKLYWFGKDSGKINYEGDLKKKVGNWELYDEKVEITEADKSVKVTLSEKPAHKVCEALFGVKPYAPYVNAGLPGDDNDIDLQATSEKKETGFLKPNEGEWNLLLVNTGNTIPEGYSVDTAKIDSSYTTRPSEDFLIDKRVKEQLIKMLDACRSAGYDPLICSAFRTRSDQEAIYEREKQGTAAVPGTSEHECGLCADIVDASYQVLDDGQAETPAQKWLMEHCQDYGFILRYPKEKTGITGISWEPWHYRYVGKEHAKVIMKNGLTLEEYVSGETLSDDEADALASGKTSNAEALYSLSINTAKLIFIALVDRNEISEAAGGSFKFPLPEGTWKQTDYFMAGDSENIRNGRKHEGVDLAAPTGTPIYASKSGIVTIAKYYGGYGNCVVIKSGDMEIYYGHMSKILVTSGVPVTAGTIIGEVGNTGNSTGPHLHFQININGTPTDPAKYLGNGVK